MNTLRLENKKLMEFFFQNKFCHSVKVFLFCEKLD